MQTIEFMGRCLACPEPVPESVSSRPTGAEGVPKFPRRWAALAYEITYDLAMLWHVGVERGFIPTVAFASVATWNCTCCDF